MSDIVLSAGVRSNLLQLQQTSDLITQTQTRLATGKRVNSALDNPINFFTAQGLTVRANDLNALLDAMSTGINTIQAANNGITAITKLVQSAQALVSQANQTADTDRPREPGQPNSTRCCRRSTNWPATPVSTASTCSAATISRSRMNEDGTSTVVVGAVNDTTAGDLAINTSANNWAHDADIAAAATQLSDRADDLAVAGPVVELESGDRPDPPGFHQGDDQHAEYRRGQPHAR